MKIARFSLILILLGALVLFLMSKAEAVADTVEGISFHPFTLDGGNNTCVSWEEPGGTTRNCDPMDLIFLGLSVTEVSDMLQGQGWSTGGIGSTQWLHFDDEVLHAQDGQLYLNESSTLRYHIRLWDAPDGVPATLGAVHHESGWLIHTIDMSWEDAETFVAGQLCNDALSCRTSAPLSWQLAIQDQDPDGSAADWRGWANDGRATVISPPPAITAPFVAISRAGDNVVLTWAAIAEATHYNVYSSSVPYFSPVTSQATVLTTSYTDTTAISDGLSNYYLVTAVDALANESDPSNQVALFLIAVSPGWNQLALPILPADTALDAVLGDQFQGTADPLTADRVLVWNGAGQTYEPAWYCGGPDCKILGPPWYRHWLDDDYAQSTLTLEPDSGFWVQNRSGVTEMLALVGDVADEDRPVAVGQNWQMLGSAFPISRTLDNASLAVTGTDSPLTADRVLVWDTGAQAYKSAWYCGGPVCEGWGEPWANHWLAGDYSPTDIVLQPGQGFWVQNRHSPFMWLNQLDVR